MDYVHVAQVVWNWLDNALKYSPPDSSVQVDAHRNGNFVTVSVHDEGPGVPASERERIFDKFYRAPSGGEARARNGHGACHLQGRH
jgi:K+-sensing histidine kinase KdpD